MTAMVKMKSKTHKKCIIRVKLKFQDYKNCLEACQSENNINHLEKIRLMQIVLKKIKNIH